MAATFSVLVFFNTDHLDQVGRYDRASRLAVAEKGTEILRGKFPQAEFGLPNPTGCSVTVSGTEEAVSGVVEFVDSQPELGKAVVNGVCVRPAS